MKTSSAKKKGRKLQKWVVQMLVEIVNCHPDDIESRPMGSQGEDVIVGNESRRRFPYSVECKNQERLSMWAAYEQAESNAEENEPLLVVKKNGKRPLAILDAEHFFHLVDLANAYEEM